MHQTSLNRAAIYIKETDGYSAEENSKEVQTQGRKEFCAAHGPGISARCHDPPDIRHDFDRMMDEATQEDPPFQLIVVYKLRNFSWSLDEAVLCRDRLRASGVTLVSTVESSP